MIAEATLAPAAKSLAGKLAVMVGRGAGDKFLGPADERRLMQVCRKALIQAAQEVNPDLRNDEFIHLAGIFEDLIGHVGVPALPVVAETGTTQELTLAGVWKDGLGSLGYDVTTLPVGLPAFIGQLSAILPEELRADAERYGSPLFPTVVIEYLVALQAHSAAVKDSLASFIPFSAALGEWLESSRKACEAAGTPYYTSHLLLALVKMPDRVVLQCLDAARPGLGIDVCARLTAYTVQLKDRHGGNYEPFLWRERTDVRQAQEFTFDAGQPVVHPAVLFRAVLGGPSNTVAELRSRVTEREFARLQDAALAAAKAGEQAATPGVIFGDLP